MTLDKIFKGSPIKRFFLVCLGAIILGISIGLFLAPANIAPGGVSGVSIMLSKYLSLGVGTLTMVLNLPLMIIAIIKWGWKFLFNTVCAIILSGITADFTSFLNPITTNPLLASVFGGAVMGLGCAVVFRCGATTGGTDIVSRLVKLKYPHLRTGTVILVIDGIISIFAGFVFKNAENALYSLIALTVFSEVLDLILYGADSAKMVIVISTKSNQITEGLLHTMGVGCTLLNGVSAYSKQGRDIILCAVKKQALPFVKDFILKTDNKAFMLVTNTGEIFGEGFKTEDSI